MCKADNVLASLLDVEGGVLKKNKMIQKMSNDH